MQAFVGTSGYSYPEWKGDFYPEKLKNADMLAHYATKLPSVEINNTFYRMPKSAVLEGWRSQVGEDFRFAVKATRRLTHFKKLKEPEELLHFLFRGLAHLGPTLGPVLFQLPPTLKADAPLLDDFLAQLPRTLPEGSEPSASGVAVLPALEFRHASWFDDEIYGILEKHGAALVSGDLDDTKKDPPLVRTAPFAYLRLRKTDEYTEEQLENWTRRLEQVGVERAFAYFKHEEQGPQFADRFASMFVK